ncbi:MAG: hypothetical protein QM305_10595 [Bacteroidota bacterium]|jgi:hypothetical protein|nr:hypothetical protein [Bacteroidota bacterium]
MAEKNNIDQPVKPNEVNEPELNYDVSPTIEIRRREGKVTHRKQFHRTPITDNFPEGCVTLDTFFSDLEDLIL